MKFTTNRLRSEVFLRWFPATTCICATGGGTSPRGDDPVAAVVTLKGSGMELDDKVCYCFKVSRRKLVNFTRQTRPSRPSQLSECFGAGTGCGWCIPFLMRIHTEVMEQDDESQEGNSLDISAEEYQQLRSTYREQVQSGDRQKNSHHGDAGGAGATPPEAGEIDDDAFA